MKPDRESLLNCLRIERWADALAGHPFDTMLGLERSAVAAATPLTAAEVDEALAAHPRIGDAPTGDDAEARFSASEQAGGESDDADLARRLAEGNAAYEQRHGRVFLIRTAGRTRKDIVAELERRLENGPAAELAEIANQLRGIALVRLRSLYAASFQDASREVTP